MTQEQTRREAWRNAEKLSEFLRANGQEAWADAAERLEAKVVEQREALEAAKIELGRHLCYTSEQEQERFWKRVHDRALSQQEAGRGK